MSIHVDRLSVPFFRNERRKKMRTNDERKKKMVSSNLLTGDSRQFSTTRTIFVFNNKRTQSGQNVSNSIGTSAHYERHIVSHTSPRGNIPISMPFQWINTVAKSIRFAMLWGGTQKITMCLILVRKMKLMHPSGKLKQCEQFHWNSLSVIWVAYNRSGQIKCIFLGMFVVQFFARLRPRLCHPSCHSSPGPTWDGSNLVLLQRTQFVKSFGAALFVFFFNIYFGQLEKCIQPKTSLPKHCCNRTSINWSMWGTKRMHGGGLCHVTFIWTCMAFSFGRVHVNFYS